MAKQSTQEQEQTNKQLRQRDFGENEQYSDQSIYGDEVVQQFNGNTIKIEGFFFNDIYNEKSIQWTIITQKFLNDHLGYGRVKREQIELPIEVLYVNSTNILGQNSSIMEMHIPYYQIVKNVNHIVQAHNQNKQTESRFRYFLIIGQSNEEFDEIIDALNPTECTSFPNCSRQHGYGVFVNDECLVQIQVVCSKIDHNVLIPKGV
ncbi:unnamed protein product (macronuclear) [Paramecium tetraurelia]|uniref:Uncharacterized protein n=1 Tax=Paramecium tetraurelia TaxID=5888 RepID=A0DIH2_PARTE|nr:uncharacterized protein GSPATT00017211001 [Paramecium tetraurelia]CAK82839.1 unnamed protein product [Paramecium tetraurelia]|eukprot:XP_001450236.1 hypothetical protein (macronuclear) [Paramecium tetraurelia strain d4-2]